MSEVFSRIKSAAQHSNSILLDEPVYVSGAVETHKFISRSACIKMVGNVPLAAIGCLVHDNVCKDKRSPDSPRPPRSWRQTVLELEQQHWDEEAICEFEESHEGQKTSTENSIGRIEFHVVGGLVSGASDLERIVAAKTWLIHKYGDDAKLSNVNVKFWPLQPGIAILAQEAVDRGCGLSICSLERLERVIEDAEGLQAACFVRLGKKEFYLKTLTGVFGLPKTCYLADGMRLLFGKPMRMGRLSWVHIPDLVLRKMLDTAWTEKLVELP
jgi:hypothetical protein